MNLTYLCDRPFLAVTLPCPALPPLLLVGARARVSLAGADDPDLGRRRGQRRGVGAADRHLCLLRRFRPHGALLVERARLG